MQFERKAKGTVKRTVFVSVLAGVVLVLTVAAILLSVFKPEEQPEQTPIKQMIALRDGEGSFNSQPTAYPTIKQEDIMVISIANSEGTYFMTRPASDQSGVLEFYYYVDEFGKYKYYSPEILTGEDDMRYDDLYAVIKGDGYDRIPMLDYLVAAIRTPYFDYRVDLDKNDLDKRNEQLKSYGLSEDSSMQAQKPIASGDPDAPTASLRTIFFQYVDENGKEGKYAIEIGSHTVTGSGYYFRVSDQVISTKNEEGKDEYKVVYRDYIYVTRESNYFKYALAGIEAYINPVLVAGGLENDQHALYAPYLTPDYRQWKTELHTLGKLPTDKSELSKVTDVLANINMFVPYTAISEQEFNLLKYDQYEKLPLGSYVFNLTEFSDNKLYSNLINALAGKDIGSGFTQSLLYKQNVAAGAKYKYIIHTVEAIMTDNGDVETEGVYIQDAKYARVTYDLLVWKDGKYELIKNLTNVTTDADGNVKYDEYNIDGHGIIDLQYLAEIGIDGAIVERLKTVGALEPFAEIEIAYKNSADKAEGDPDITYGKLRTENMNYYLDTVLEIYQLDLDEEGNVKSSKRVNKIEDGKDYFVAYRYYYADGSGKAQNAKIGYINFSSKPAEGELTSAEKNQNKIREVIKKWVNSDDDSAIKVFSETIYTDVISNVVYYEFEKITGYVTGDIVSAFKFVNASERDPFYGESFYEKPNDNKNYMLYAVSQDACQKVVRLLGGLTETSQAGGLVGKETVEVGITAEALDKYIFRLGKEGGDIYGANIVRFSLPRELYVSVETEDTELDDYSWLRTLDFMLYISAPVWDPDTESMIRYVASEMYDLIVKIDADVISFVDLDTVDFWARRNLVLLDSKNLAQLDIEFMMDDLDGAYRFNLLHDDDYTPPGSITPYDWIEIYVTTLRKGQGDAAFKTKLDEYGEYLEAQTGRKAPVSLSDFYNYLAGEQVSDDNDSRGTGMFKEILVMLYLTNYMGTLTDEEQRAALESGPIMRMSLKLNDSDKNADTNRIYWYEFYRCDDRRIMVKIYETDIYGNLDTAKGTAQDFYITALAFEKIAVNFIGLLNGEILDANDPYPGYKPIG